MKSEERMIRDRQPNRCSLDEVRSKRLLSGYGIPVTKEAVAQSPDQAVSLAEGFGFPVAVKGFGSRLTHKTERGIVHLDLQTPETVKTAFSAIQKACGQDFEGCLIQPMVRGQREFTAGLIKDPQFGPVIMFGLGGIYAQALDDVVFRIAPVTEAQALEMLDGLKTGVLLNAFRGQAPINTPQAVKLLTGLSRLGIDRPDILEVDINPLIVEEDGSVTAVDALVILADETAAGPCPDTAPPKNTPEQIKTDLDVMLHPRSVAVVGVRRQSDGPYPGIYQCIKNFGYKGRLYPVNPKAAEIDGVKAYPGIRELPEPADLVILSVPARQVPDALRDCAAKGCKNVHIFTSGFAETGEQDGIRLQDEVRAIALENGLNIIGPNCMGLHVPSENLLTWINASHQSGPVAMISQSGGNAQDYAHLANRSAIYFSKVISYGNAVTMDCTDFLDYFETDGDTEMICMYIEGVRDGRKLLEQVRRISGKKPVVIYKGGLTESGARTAASHTGALAGGEKIWKGFFRQSGAIPVNSLDEMAQVTLALKCLPKIRGRGVAILGTGGGIGVAAADACARYHLNMPELSAKIRQKLREYIPPAGNIITNPVDAHGVITNLDLMGPFFDLLSGEPNLDLFILSLHLDWIYEMDRGAHIEKIAGYLALQAREHLNGKPLTVVWRQYQPNPDIAQKKDLLAGTLLQAGIPVFDNLDTALQALSRTAGYHLSKRKRE